MIEIMYQLALQLHNLVVIFAIRVVSMVICDLTLFFTLLRGVCGYSGYVSPWLWVCIL